MYGNLLTAPKVAFSSMENLPSRPAVDLSSFGDMPVFRRVMCSDNDTMFASGTYLVFRLDLDQTDI